MSQELHVPNANAGALKSLGLLSGTEALEPAQAETMQVDGKLVRKDRHVAAETEPIGQDTIITPTLDPHVDENCTPPVPCSLPDATLICQTQVGDDMVGTVLGDYKLLRKLGQGGMGEVYEAYQISLDRIVALKLLARKLSNNARFVQRLQREARTMAKVDHLNILRCFDVGNANGYSFLTMEYISGGTIENWLKKLGRFSLGDALHIILKIAYALQHAHERNIIHRDIKPDNILMTQEGVIKLADLGLAKDTEKDFSLTKTGTSAGTPIYMAPEQARDAKRVDGRVDIYALGVMLYVFLTGAPPFMGRTFVELMAAKDRGTFDPIRKRMSEIPAKLDLIVDRMLEKDPNRRFANCSDVIALIEALGLANETLSFLGMETPTAQAPIRLFTQAPRKLMVPAKTNVVQPAEQEFVEQGVWYLHLVKGQGKIVTMKATTQQIQLLIRTRNLDGEAQISKTEISGFRGAATFAEFQAFFERREMNVSANVSRPEVDKPINVDEKDAERVPGFGVLWILLLLAVAAVGGYFFYINMFAAT